MSLNIFYSNLKRKHAAKLQKVLNTSDILSIVCICILVSYIIFYLFLQSSHNTAFNEFLLFWARKINNHYCLCFLSTIQPALLIFFTYKLNLNQSLSFHFTKFCCSSSPTYTKLAEGRPGKQRNTENVPQGQTECQRWLRRICGPRPARRHPRSVHPSPLLSQGLIFFFQVHLVERGFVSHLLLWATDAPSTGRWLWRLLPPAAAPTHTPSSISQTNSLTRS